MTGSVPFDPDSPAFHANPYPRYESLRALDPVAYYAPWRTWLVTGYQACHTLLRDRRLGHISPEGSALLFQNPPDHTRLRALMNIAFGRQQMERMERRIQTITGELLDRTEGAGGMDVMAALAYPLPVIVIAELLGVPAADRDRFGEWSRALTAGVFDLTRSERLHASRVQATQALEAYLRALIEGRKGEDQGGLLASLVAARDSGDRLSDVELYTNAILLLVAGHITTVNMIGSGILALLRFPDQRQRLRDDRALLPSAVEEVLRYDSPLQLSHRSILESFEFEGRHFAEGDVVALFLGAANRDPARFAQPDVFDVSRSPNPHLAFGGGIHFCIGAALARAEGAIAIRSVLDRFPRLALGTQDVPFAPSHVLRGPAALRVTF